MPPSAPVVVVKGNLKVYVNDSNLLERTLTALDDFAKSDKEDHAFSDIATAASAIQDEVSQAFGRPVKSLRDAIYLSRQVLPPKLTKQLQALNTTHSFLRHVTTMECAGFVAQVKHNFRAGAAPVRIAKSTPSSCLTGWQHKTLR